MAKVSIIEIELETSVESIINDDLNRITGDNRSRIDAAVAVATATQTVARQKSQQEEAKANKLTVLHSRLTGGATVSSQELLALAAPEMDNLISVVGSLRNWLETNDPQHKLSAVKKGKTKSYKLEPINGTS